MAWFSRAKPEAVEKNLGLQSVDDRGWTRIFDWIPGAWQSHSPLDNPDSVVSNPVVFSCVTLIAGDIGKLCPTVERKSQYGIWEPVDTAMSVLKRPNNYQNHIQFKKWWLHSKLIHGNTYVLKIRDNRGQVARLQILDPLYVMPMVSESGEVFYRLDPDDLSQLRGEQVTVPATEVMHDRCHELFHPLIGLSPIFGCSVAAEQGLAIQKDSKYFFQGGAKPSGVLTAPGSIGDETAARLKAHWETNFTGEKAGKVAVLGDGLKYEAMRMNSVDAQLIQQLGWSAERIAACFSVPAYKVGVGPMPTHDNIEALTQDYYSQCLQRHIEEMEALLHEGLGLPDDTRVQLDLDGLFRMDSERKTRTLSEGVKGSIMAPNEARKRLNLPPLVGGDSVYLQQQNYSLEALAQRDATNPLAVAPTPEPVPEPEDQTEKALMLLFTKDMAA